MVSRVAGMWGLGLLTWFFPFSVQATDLANPEQGQTRSAKLFGQIDLSPLEPVRGLFVRVGSEKGCCQSDPDQEVWPETSFELDLAPASRYEIEGIGVFVEPWDDATDAYYYLRPTQSFDLSEENAEFSFSHGLRAVFIKLSGDWGRKNTGLSIEAKASLPGVDFISVREWNEPFIDSSWGTTLKEIWVPEDVPVTLAFKQQLSDDFGGLVQSWSMSIEPDQAFVLSRKPYLDWIFGELRLHGNSVPLAPSRIYVADDQGDPYYGRVLASGRFLLRPPDDAEGSLQIQPMLVFEDGSSTSLAQHPRRFGVEGQTNDLEYELDPTEIALSVEASFPLERLRMSIAQGLTLQDATATQEVSAQLASANRAEFATTLQLPAGEWALSGFSANHDRVYWWTQYKSWEPELDFQESPSSSPLDFGEALSLAHARVPEWRAVTSLENAPTHLQAQLIDEGRDRIGSYIDSIRIPVAAKFVFGRSGHRYRVQMESSDINPPDNSFALDFGRAQPVTSEGWGLVGRFSSGPGRCDGVELLYREVEEAGEMTINRISLPSSPPFGYEVWPKDEGLTQTVDLRKSATFPVGSQVQVCMQYSKEALDFDGFTETNIELGYRTRVSVDPTNSLQVMLCAPGNRYVNEGWCLMPKTDPAELAYFLDMSETNGCAWRCGLADARALDTLSFLRPVEAKKIAANCQRGDVYRETELGFVLVPPSTRLSSAFDRGRRVGKYTGKDLLRRHRGNKAYVRSQVRRLRRELREPTRFGSQVDFCEKRGRIAGLQELLADGSETP